MAGRTGIKSKIRSQQLNPVFHFQNKKEDDDVLTTEQIKQSRVSGVLNLSGRGLGTVPVRIWRLNDSEPSDNDTRYDMTKNSEEAWWNQKALTNLDLSSNSLTAISSDISNLLSLTVLNLHDNALTSLPNEIGALENLTRINLSHNKLTELPKNFFKLRELKVINLSHNKFVELSADLIDMIMLESLDISNNNLTSLPVGIGFLVRLNQLTLSHNHLKELPTDIVNLRNLQKLDVMKNDLTHLPPLMGELRKLECIYAQHNDVQELPDFQGCDALKELHISNNFIKEITVDFCEYLPQLKILDLRDNKIEVLPEEISQLQNLTRLDLSNNTIYSLPCSLATLSHLVSLQVEGNPIRSIRRDIIQCGTTRVLKTLKDRAGLKERLEKSNVKAIGSNDTDFPDRFQMKKNHTMNVSARNLTEIPENVFIEAVEASVTIVDLSKNKLTAIPDGLSHLEFILTELNMFSNQLKTIPKFIAQFDKICFMNLANNALETLPDEIGLLNTMRELNISNNKIKVLPKCVYSLKALQILLARDNAIEEIDATADGLGGLPSLATLDFGNNNIKQVPPILGNLKQITTLELNGNSFRQPRHQILAKGTEAIMAYLRDRIPQ